MTTERFLTTGEVAKICKVTIPAVRKWCLKQGLEYTSVGAGKAIRIRLEDLRTFWEFKHGDIPESLQRVLDGGEIKSKALKILVVGGRTKEAVLNFFSSLDAKHFKLATVADGSEVKAYLKKNKPELILVVVGGNFVDELVWVKALRTKTDNLFTIVAFTSQGNPASPAPFDKILPKSAGQDGVLEYILGFKAGK